MRKSLLLLVVLLFVGSFASAQVSNNTQLVGTITDPSGGVVSGAKITATNTGTQVQYEGTTNAEGYYTIPFVAPGTYDITVEQAGFAKTVSKGAIVILNQSARTDITLKVGDVASVVQVTADTPALSTDDALIGDTVERAKVENLPMNTRRVMDLATTASNVIIGPKTSFTGVPPGANYIGAGTREVANSLTLDGITIMNSLISSSPVTPNPDA
ncbi:MAG: carboxypeptidase regulatory-like domain-containing protein, partial [Acidobacteria bacterium]|nr:carboxypeptidase regulatory-like domain-containing protein [Acidobacteriota bacterium]